MSKQEPSNRTRVGILGAGYIADYHCASLARLPSVELAAICDLVPERVAAIADTYGIPARYTDLAAMIEAEALDVIHILTPPQLHRATAQQILEAGCDVFIEKPLSHTTADCDALIALAREHGRTIGTGHNFLFFETYEAFCRDLEAGRLGPLDHVEVVWGKPLGQLRGGPFGAWMLADPRNILFEVAPHSFAHMAHLLPCIEDLDVTIHDRVELPRDLVFYRKWLLHGRAGRTTVSARFSFDEAYPEHQLRVRGANGLAILDFEANTYVVHEHTAQLLDIDRFLTTARTSLTALIQSGKTLAHFLLSKVRLSRTNPPFPRSIDRAIECFYETRGRELDERLGTGIGRAAVELAERAARAVEDQIQPLSAERNDPAQAVSVPDIRIAVHEPIGPADTLVVGATGFIGQALVKSLCERGFAVRVLVRDPRGCPNWFEPTGVDVVRGSLSDEDSIRQALLGIRNVFHLARGGGNTWSDFESTDVQPTLRFAEICQEQGVERFNYTSSISIYGEPAGATITETTLPSEGIARTNAYAKSKIENERRLTEMHRDKGLPLVIFRPGIVVGEGSSPYHWGIGEWAYSSVCRLWGTGNDPLPLVLVDDVASAMAASLEVTGIEGASFNLCGPAIVTANDYLDAFESAAGLRVKRLATPAARHFGEAVIKWGIKTAGRDPEATRPSYANFSSRVSRAHFSNAAACQKLGWEPVSDRETLIRLGVEFPTRAYFEQS